jgi:prolyl oligopeptidase
MAALILGVLFSVQLLIAGGASDQKGQPTTRREAVTDVLHSTEIVDHYRWLEDQKSPETREWIDAQNAYTESLLSAFPGREHLKQRLAELMKVDVINMPAARNGRYFFTRRSAKQDLSVIYMREGIEGQDQILIDPHTMSDDLRTSVNISVVSDDGKLLVYGVRQGGEDEVEVRILDVDQRKDLDRLAKARYFGMSITPDNKTLYYTRHGAEGSRVFSHKMGTKPSQAQEIFGEG